MSSTPAVTTVYFDGSCPLCRSEIAHYQGQAGADKLAFVDVSRADATLGDGLDQRQAMARFHVRHADGTLVSGARAFATIWSALPRWRWAARVAALPGVTPLLDAGYQASLYVRPLLARVVAARAKRGNGTGGAR